jgi:hypothetical protein
VVDNPERVEPSYKDRKVAQRTINQTHLLRVIFEEEDDEKTVITFYPARRDRYEN